MQKALPESISKTNSIIHQSYKVRKKTNTICNMLKMAFCIGNFTLHTQIQGENTGYF